MSDLAETFNALRESTKRHRAEMLATADTTGWQKLTPYHFRRQFGAVRVDWWPSGGKAQVFENRRPPRMVYGHRKVAALIENLALGKGGQEVAK